MLQQTQVATASGYYLRFLQRFPDVRALARASLEQVLQAWAGLGYYARARHAHACAQAVLARHGGHFPRSARALESLPGIGSSTAAAIAALCFGERAAILDGNVKRVLARQHAVDGDPARAATLTRLRALARAHLPPEGQMAAYTQGLMDLGAMVCTRVRPRCDSCPVRAGCQAHALGRTAELPQGRERAVRPVRRAHLLLALHRRAAWLEQRPPRGLWGGLLSPPQFTHRAQLETAARALGGGMPQALAPRRHAFTHFTLLFTPYVLRVARRPRAGPAPGRWLPLTRIEGAALPAPVLALMRELRDAR